jgi:methionyl-tRNA formyltransferase
MCGCHISGYWIIKGLLEEGVTIQYFVTLNPQQAKHNSVAGYFDFSDLAKKFSIPVYYPEDYALQSDKDVLFFKENRFDLMIPGGWQRLFPDNILENLKIGALGIHGSPDFLPKGRGRSPLNWSLIQGKKRFISHLFFLKPGVDDGDIIDTEMFDINEFDDISTLYMKNALSARKMILKNLQGVLSGTVETRSQQGVPSYYKKRIPEDGLIDWETMDVWEIYNFVRGQTHPYPGAYGRINEKMRRIWHCQVFDTKITFPDAKYGECVESIDNKLIINCLGGLLLVDEYEEFS